jgi:lipopolysaccharide export system permease protein
VLLVAVPVVLLAALLTLQLAPRAAVAETALRAAALRSALSVPIQPGQFRSLGGGRTVVYARGVAPDGELLDVFIKRGLGDTVEATVARRARMVVASDGLSQTILLQDGERLEGTPGIGNWRIVRFGMQSIPLVLPGAKPGIVRRSELATAGLLGSANAAERTELQTRFSWPLLTLVVALLALPLGRLRPRQSRFARVWIAVLLFALYANLLQVAGLWLERGVTPSWLGLWWVHGLVTVVVWAALAAPRWLGRS